MSGGIAPLLAGLLLAAGPAVEGEPVVSTRGITGRIVVESEHGHVRGRPDLDLDSAILVRVAGRERRDDGRAVTTLEFIGVDAGVFDLRESLVFEDGGTLERLPPLPIEIVSNLASDAPSDVFLAEAPPATIAGGYRTLLMAVAVAWLLVPVAIGVRRRLRREVPPAPAAPPPSLRDRLEPLVRQAADRVLTVDEQGRLELLLLAYWRERLGLDDDAFAAIAAIRADPEAGRLLRRVEAWLHAPNGAAPSPGEIRDLLAPYGGSVAEDVR